MISNFQSIGAGAARRGPVGLAGHSTVDLDGEFNALASTFFPLRWLFEHDRDDGGSSIAALADAGVHVLRSFGFVGFPGDPVWGDRMSDPRDPAAPQRLADAIAWANGFGPRVQVTIFGGTELVYGDDFERLTDAVAEALSDRLEMVAAVEVCNEYPFRNGLNGPQGEARLRALGNRLRDRLPGTIVLLSSVGPDSACMIHSAGTAPPMGGVVHYERDLGPDGWRPIRQPWGGHELWDPCPQFQPGAPWNNEPGWRDVYDSPIKVAASYAVSALSGNALYCWHNRAGVYHGGAWGQSIGDPARIVETPNWPAIRTALRATRDLLPPGLPNWHRHNGHWPSAPLDFKPALDAGKLNRAYAAVNGERLLIVPFGIVEDLRVPSRVSAHLLLRDPQTCEVIREFDVSPGTVIEIPKTLEAYFITAGLP
jgi:hypothetical protein